MLLIPLPCMWSHYLCCPGTCCLGVVCYCVIILLSVIGLLLPSLACQTHTCFSWYLFLLINFILIYLFSIFLPSFLYFLNILSFPHATRYFVFTVYFHGSVSSSQAVPPLTLHLAALLCLSSLQSFSLDPLVWQSISLLQSAVTFQLTFSCAGYSLP